MLRSKTLRLPEVVDISAAKSRWLKSSVVIGREGFSAVSVASTVSMFSGESSFSSAVTGVSSCSGIEGTAATFSVVAAVSSLSFSSVVTATGSLSSVTFPAASTVTSFSVTSSGTQAIPPSGVLTGCKEALVTVICVAGFSVTPDWSAAGSEGTLSRPPSPLLLLCTP